MKQLLISLMMVLALSMNTEAVAQKHRHTPRTEQVDSTKTKDAIEAFSDTTAVAKDAEDAEDDQYVTRSVTYSSKDAQELKEVMETMGGFFGPWVAVSIVSIIVIFLLAPLLIILVVFYFVNKNRKERYKLAQMAIQNGQPIPDEVLKGNTPNTKEDSNDYTAGLRQIFLGIGLAIFLGIVAGKIGFGIGALVFCIGLGKVVIAKMSGANSDPLNDNHVDNYNNPSNNYNNE
jgi:flagellar basal body-associated protein FliL